MGACVCVCGSFRKRGEAPKQSGSLLLSSQGGLIPSQSCWWPEGVGSGSLGPPQRCLKGTAPSRAPSLLPNAEKVATEQPLSEGRPNSVTGQRHTLTASAGQTGNASQPGHQGAIWGTHERARSPPTHAPSISCHASEADMLRRAGEESFRTAGPEGGRSSLPFSQQPLRSLQHWAQRSPLLPTLAPRSAGGAHICQRSTPEKGRAVRSGRG